MTTKYKFTLAQVMEYYNRRTLRAKNEILFQAILEMEANAGKHAIFECIAYAMKFWKQGEDAYILEDYAREFPEDKFQTIAHLDQWVNTWLHNTYGLEDNDKLDAGEAEELCAQITYDMSKEI